MKGWISELRAAAGRGVIRGVEWAIVILLLLFAADYVLGIRQAAIQGSVALRVINAYQEAGVLPKQLPAPQK